MIVDRVDVTPSRVGLPDLDQRVADRPAVGIQHPPVDHDPLAQRLAPMLPGQIGVSGSDWNAPEDRARRTMKPLVGQPHRTVAGRTQLRGAVVRIEVRRFVFELGHDP